MSWEAEIALLREAYHALPDGTPHERTVYVMALKRQILSGAPVKLAAKQMAKAKVASWSQVADPAEDAVMRRLCGEREP